MPKNKELQKIFIIGSGPIMIGQGCEFDYSGTQACKALRAEGCKIILLNSNPATIMTDQSLADATYIAPLTVETCEEIIHKERPDALLSTVGGQTALNLSLALEQRGILRKYHVRLIGATASTIEKAENRRLFREAMLRIGLQTADADTITHCDDLEKLQEQLQYPLLVRTSFTLGGDGSGIVHDYSECYQLCERLFLNSAVQTLELEECLLGWKEFEMEAIRDAADNCIIVCSLENIDPMGVHTGDSITVAPAQTLNNEDYQRMRTATFAILREIGVDTGGANVQFAVHPETGRMIVIEMNPRVSRSSALASKATGYPIAKVATQLALGYTLDEISNSLTTEIIPAAFEPSIDYVVTKLPRFNFEKFPHCDGILTTRMQSTGEVIGLGRNFKESLQKAICSLEIGMSGLQASSSMAQTILVRISQPYYDRLFYIAEAFRQGMTMAMIQAMTAIDPWFLQQIADLVLLEQQISQMDFANLEKHEFKQLKRQGFSDQRLAELWQQDAAAVRIQRHALGVMPVYKQVDSCAAEFAVKTRCLYSTYETECEAKPSQRKKIIIIGSGPNRIGQGLEFDYGSVHAALACRELGYETIMINSNPETVSTDYDSVDRLYLEPLTLEHVLNIIELEKPTGIITQFGGQTPLHLLPGLAKVNAPLIGTEFAAINACENRDLFRKITAQLGLMQPDNFCITHREEGINRSATIHYPVISRPSYLLSGSSMCVLNNEAEFLDYMESMADEDAHFPILIEQFLKNAIEVEVDGVSDGETVFIPGVMEQAEPLGVHSGDSICCFPAYSLSAMIQEKIIDQAKQLALACHIVGAFNIQFAVKNDSIFIIELNPRCSRTVPFLSKALGISLPQIATRCILGQKFSEQNKINMPQSSYFAIKIPTFPFARLGACELGPNMRSTGEKMFFTHENPAAHAGFIAAVTSLVQPLQELTA